MFNLPVHRVGGYHRMIFAYTEELDAWLHRDGRMAAAESETSARDLLINGLDNNAEQESKAPPASALSRLGNKLSARASVQAGYDMWRFISHNNLPTICEAFRNAIDYDPENADAFAGLAHALIAQAIIGSLGLALAYSMARTAAEAASTHDSDSAESQSATAWLKMILNRDWEGARVIFDRLLGWESVSTRVMAGRALLYIAQGNLAPASELLYQATQRHPLSPIPYSLHCWSEYLRGDYARVTEQITEAHATGRSERFLAAVEALTWIQLERPPQSLSQIERLLAEDPANDVVRGALGYIAARSGDRSKASSVLEYLANRRSVARGMPHYALALTYLGLNRKEEAIRAVISSYNLGSVWSFGFHIDPVLRPLAQDSAFSQFLLASYPATSAQEMSLG